MTPDEMLAALQQLTDAVTALKSNPVVASVTDTDLVVNHSDGTTTEWVPKA